MEYKVLSMGYDGKVIDLKKAEYKEVIDVDCDSFEVRPVPIMYRPHPIYPDMYCGAVNSGQTILEAVESVPNLEDRFFEIGIVRMNGDVVPRAMWQHVKMKPYNDAKPVVLTMHMDPAGGLSKKVKNVILIVAAVALVAATGFIGAGGLATLFPGVFSAASFGAGTLGASLAAAAVGAAGALALSALTPSPISADTGGEGVTNKADSYARGNLIEPGGAVPRVIGTYRIFPVLACQPITELFDDGDTVVEALFMLAGPHDFSDLKVDDVGIEDINDIQTETRQGFDTDIPISLITRHGFTKQANLEMSRHKMEPVTSSIKMRNNATADQDSPQWTTLKTKLDPDEFWIQLALIEGLYSVAAPATNQAIFFAVRIRPEDSSDYINLPLLHLEDNRPQQLKKAIKLIWDDTPPTVSTIATGTKGWNRIFQYWPPATGEYLVDGSKTDMLPWIADSSFAVSPVTSGTNTKVADKGIRTTESTAEIFLDSSIFPRGKRWVVQIKRGFTFPFNVTNYTTGVGAGTIVHDTWGFYIWVGNATIQYSQDDRPSRSVIVNVISVYNTHPIARKNMALMAIKARNQAVNAFSVLASGLVNDWNGTEWLGLVATSNPAPHLREVWAGMFNADPLESDVIDEANLVAWRQWCIYFNHTVDMIADGRTVLELSNIIAACGRAKVRMSDLWGVFYDRSRESVLDTPVQVFSPRTTNNFAFMKAFEKRPHAFRVTWRDSTNDYNEDEMYVAAPDSSLIGATIFEAISIEGIVEEAKVRNRVFYDHLQLYFRDTIFSLDVDFAALVCRMGDYVGVNHDAMVLQHGHARVKVITLNAGNVESITLDAEVLVEEVTVDLFALADVFAAVDFFALDVQTGVALALSDNGGSVITKLVSNSPGATKVLTFSPTFAPPAGLEPGIYVTVGRTERIYDEFIVVTINPTGDLNATLILSPYNPYMYGDEIGIPWASDGLYFSDGTGWSW